MNDITTKHTKSDVSWQGILDANVIGKLHSCLVIEDSELFFNIFGAYLQHGNDDTAFVVSLEDVWHWMGFSRKDKARRLLEDNFVEGVDYNTVSVVLPSDVYDHTSQIKNGLMTFLNVDTLKEMCVLANNHDSKQIRKNYVMMEHVLMQHMTQCLAEQKEMTIKAFALVDEQKAKVEEQKAILLALDEELKNIEDSYVEVMKHEHVYINKSPVDLHRNAHMLGMTLDPKTCEARMSCVRANGTKNVFVQKTSNSRLVEMITSNSVQRYNIGGIGRNKRYNCDIEHTVAVIKVSAAVVDTLVSCRSSLSCNDICDVVIKRMNDIKSGHESDLSKSEAQSCATPTHGQSSKIESFFNMSDIERKCVVTFGDGGVTSVLDLEKAFAKAMSNRGEQIAGYKFSNQELTHIQSYGCSMSKRSTFVCMSCRNLAKSGCCSGYSQTNRRKKFVLFGMKLRVL